VDPARPCPCGLGPPYGECCGRLHAGAAAATAELLLRSRYTAFAVGDSAYLQRTWHPSTRPDDPGVDPSVQWRRLEVLGTAGGGPFEREGTVRFRAHLVRGGRRGVVDEDSRFVREGGQWLYVGEVPSPVR
jgi:SEC-C motif-containing protein